MNGKKRTKNVSMYQSKPIQFVLIELILSYHVYTSVSNYRTIVVFTVRVKFYRCIVSYLDGSMCKGNKVIATNSWSFEALDLSKN